MMQSIACRPRPPPRRQRLSSFHLLVLFVCLLAVSVATVSCVPSDTRQELASIVESRMDGASPSPNSLLESIWKSFKQTFESTGHALSSTLSSSHHAVQEDESMQSSHEQPQRRDEFSKRRILLLEQSLSEHYTNLFVGSSPRLSRAYQAQQAAAARLSDDGDGRPMPTSSSPPGSAAASTAVRWDQAGGGSPGNTCHCLSESAGSYWSFQWCPHVEAYQGRRDEDGSFRPRYSLGRTSGGSTHGGRDGSDGRRLADVAKATYPDAAAVELYVDGDPCETESGRRRTSVVVTHDSTSDRCPDAGGGEGESGPSRLGTMLLAGVDEPRLCQYVFHVCMPPPPPSSASGRPLKGGVGTAEPMSPSHLQMASVAASITESDAKEIHRTLHHLQYTIDSYLRQTGADVKRKATADVLTALHIGLPPMPQTKVKANLKLIKDMVMHAYDGYFYHGFPASEVKPITCEPSSFNLVRIPGLTLIDSLDTLVVVGNYTEFARAVERLRTLDHHMAEESGIFKRGGLFALNQNVSVFETNIRVLGGLLSAHQLAVAFLDRKVLEDQVWADDKSILFGTHRNEGCKYSDAQEPTSLANDCDSTSILNCRQEPSPKAVCHNRTSKYWVYDGFLLELARDIGDRLLPAFDTPTGIPYGTVNLLSGIPEGETTVASLAGGGTLSLEMELLSRLTGNEDYGRAAKLAARALWMRRSPSGLLGKHICTRRGEWTETLSGIGSNSDSFYEYLIKHHILFPEDDDFWVQLVSAYGGVHNESRLGEWYSDVDMARGLSRGGASRRVFEALMAFYPGMQVLLGEISPAARTLNSFFLVREHLGFLPERFNYASWRVDSYGGKHLLRPELLESAYFLHRASKGVQHQFTSETNSSSMDTSGWQWAADFALHALEKLTRTRCGYGSVRELSAATTGALNSQRSNVKLLNEMPSYFLSETLKYLYLIFDDKNVLHADENRDWVFTTEAHPIHHEEKTRSNKRVSKLEQQKMNLQQRLRKRLKNTGNTVLPAFDGLHDEKWTEWSNLRTYREQLESVWLAERNTYEIRKATSEPGNGYSFFPHIVEPVLPFESSPGSFDTFNDRLNTMNPSYLSFHTLGQSSALTKSCPNLYLTDLLWIRALNGGFTDYADSYMSRVQDAVAVTGLSSVMLGSCDALALHGSGLHIKSIFDEHGKNCPVRDPSASNENPSLASPESSAEEQNDGLVRIDMGEGLGKFEVSAFPGGTGFVVERMESGETVMTTLIGGEDDDHDVETYVLVYASTDVGEDIAAESARISPDSRSVVVADLSGNSYSCMVQIVETTVAIHGDSSTCARDANEARGVDELSSNDPREQISVVVAQFPCAPALFGPSHLSHLRDVDAVVVEAAIQTPKLGDEYGCDSSRKIEIDCEEEIESIDGVDLPAEVCMYSVIQMVHRGICTFQEKSKIQRQVSRAGAVIVINTEDDELFVMSGGGASEQSDTASDDFPLTVLVTGSDGQSIIDIVDSFGNNGRSQLQGRVTLVRGETEVATGSNGALSITGNKFWPSVRAGAEGIQIFSRSGWGVHAIKTTSETSSVAPEWQLFLMKHNVQP